MSISEIKHNLKNSIVRKEILLATYENPDMNAYPNGVRNVMIQSLSTQIDELKDILSALEEIK